MTCTRVKISELPPSVNNLYANKKGGGRIISKKYAAWRKTSGWEVLAQRPQPIKGRYVMRIIVKRPHQNCDVSNRLKPIEDLMVKMGVIENDNLAEFVSIEWGEPEKVLVEIKPFLGKKNETIS